MEIAYEQPKRQTSTIAIVVVAVVGLVVGGLLGYSWCYSGLTEEIDDLGNQLATMEQQIVSMQATQNATYSIELNSSVSELYAQVKDSVVVIRGLAPAYYDIFGHPYYSQVQGSGFVYNFTGQMVVVTNYHVVADAVNISVTFSNGNAYSASVLGSDPYSDLAVLSTDAPQTECKPLEMVSSSTLDVGDPVLVVGTPYGLAGSMSTGYVSALGRTLNEETTGGYVIANVIQTTAALNPGNSGGPVLNYLGQVVGIATAIVEDSEGLGFAIPSNTVLREISDLVNTGTYENHPWLGASGTDMSYEIAQKLGTNVTYGWLIAHVTNNGPADKAGLQGGTQQITVVGSLVTVGGDILIAVNGTRITGIDSLSAYLEEYTLPEQTVELTIIRDTQTINVSLVLESRPTT
jgi:S1-C subfamily serine protease